MPVEAILAFGWMARASLYFHLTKDQAVGVLVRLWLPGVDHIRS